MIKAILSIITGLFIPNRSTNGYRPIGVLHIPPKCKTWNGMPGYTPKKPTPAPMPQMHFERGCIIGDAPPPVHQNGRPIPPPKRGTENIYKEMQKVKENIDNINKNVDNVNHPAHYKGRGGIECIDAIAASMTQEEFQGYLKGTAEAYLWRYKNKGRAKEDLEKAKWYINKLIDEFPEQKVAIQACYNCRWFIYTTPTLLFNGICQKLDRYVGKNRVCKFYEEDNYEHSNPAWQTDKRP